MIEPKTKSEMTLVIPASIAREESRQSFWSGVWLGIVVSAVMVVLILIVGTFLGGITWL